MRSCVSETLLLALRGASGKFSNSKPPEHDADHGEANEGCGLAFEITSQAAMPMIHAKCVRQSNGDYNKASFDLSHGEAV